MSRIVLNIRGGNGSGKSTVVKMLSEQYPRKVETVSVNGKKTKITVCDGGRIVVLGAYEEGKCGGCDRFEGGDHVKSTIVYCAEKYHPELIIYEGIIMSTTYKMATEIAQLCGEIGYSWRTVFMYRDLSEMIQLVLKRNGGNTNRLKHVIAKHKMVFSTFQKLKQNGYPTEAVDVTGLNIEEMFSEVNKVVKRLTT